MNTHLPGPFLAKQSAMNKKFLAFFSKFWHHVSVEYRRSYSISIVVNDRKINEVIIDPHYEKRHAESITDEIILALARKLDGGDFKPEDNDEEFQYFKTEPIEFGEKNYRLIWLLKNDCLYIGIINAFRRK